VTSGIAGQDRAHGLLEGDRTASGPARQWRRCSYFPPALPRLCIAKQNSRTSTILRFAPALRFRLRLRPLRASADEPLRVLVRSACRLVIATKAAMSAADPAKDLSP
jgi:hypothetical protein